MAEELSVVGKPLPRVDGLDKVTGRATFAGDMRLPGMLYARTLRSPWPHADIIGLDTGAAESHPGVLAVITYKDSPKVPLEADDEATQGGGQEPSGVGVLDNRVRFVGDEVAAVAAVDRHTAEAALKLIKVEYKPLPFVLDSEEALRPDAPKVRAGGNLAGGKPTVLKRGNADQGFAQADFIYEDTYETPLTSALPLEPRACLADWRGDRLTVWKCGRNVYGDRATMAKVFSLPLDNVRVVGPAIGSSYGNKDESRQAFIAALLSRKAGRPVLSEYTRQEELISGRLRHPSRITVKMGLKKDGTITAIYGKSVLNTGPYVSGTGVTRRSAQGIIYLYTCANVMWEGYTVYTNSLVAGSYRGLGAPQGHFALESLVDKICLEQGWDPLEFRLRNGVKLEGQPGPKYVPNNSFVDPQPVAGGIPFSSNGLRECLEKGAAAAGWPGRQKSGTATGSKRRGIGCACFIYQTGQAASAAIVKVNGDGTVSLLMGTQDVGQGSNTVLTQMCAEELGVPLSAVHGTFADTQNTPFSHGTFGSTTTFSSGMAAKMAAADAKQQILALAAGMLGTPAEALDIRAGNVVVKTDPNKKVAVSKVVAVKGDSMIMGQAAVRPGSKTSIVNSFGAHFAEVEVDTETGEVKLLRLITAHDCGRPINPLMLENQMFGGALQGVGFALTEEIVLDKSTGRPVTNDLCWFRVPTIQDIPQFHGIVADVVDPVGPFGAKAQAEPGLVPTAPAIANAVLNAIGVQIKTLPLTPTRVLAALNQAVAKK